MSKTNQMNSKWRKKDRLISTLFIIFQAVVSCVFIGLLYQLNLLPLKYMLVVVLVIAFLFLLILSSQLIKKRHSKRKLGGRILSVILMGLMLFSSNYVLKANKLFNNVSGGNFETVSVPVYVLTENPAQSITDIKDGIFAINKVSDRANTDQAIQKINDYLGEPIDVQEYDTYQDMLDALLSGEVDAMIMNEAYEAITEQHNEDFDTLTRILYSVEIRKTLSLSANKKDITDTTFTMYISGIDTYGPVSTVSRSDVNILVTVNPKTHQILLTNIPRDYYVTLHTYQAKDKLTHAGIYGIEESIATLEDLIGIDVDYYARVNFSSVEEIVDALGGITVDNPQYFTTGQYDFPAGQLYLDGSQALSFSRERYSFAGGDRERGKNQQRVIVGMINKMTSSAILTNYSSILDAVSGSFQTNMSSSEIQSLVKMQIEEMAGWEVLSYSLDGSGASLETYSYGSTPLYVMIPYEDTVSTAYELITRMNNGEIITLPQ